MFKYLGKNLKKSEILIFHFSFFSWANECLEDEYEAPCERIDIMQFCIKKRLDKPAALGGNMHLKKAKNMFHGKDKFKRAIDRSFE